MFRGCRFPWKEKELGIPGLRMFGFITVLYLQENISIFSILFNTSKRTQYLWQKKVCGPEESGLETSWRWLMMGG